MNILKHETFRTWELISDIEIANETINILLILLLKQINGSFPCKVENLHSTDDGESSEKSHGASNCWQHVHKLCWFIHGDFVKSWCVKVDPHKSQLVFPLIIYLFWKWEVISCIVNGYTY